MPPSVRDKLADPKYKAEDFEIDKRLNNGPLMDRPCTDVLCMLIFVCFMAGFVVISAYGFMNGNVEQLLAPLDADGNLCGVTPGYEQYKLLYFQNLELDDWLASAVCVSSCPDKNDQINCKPTKNVTDCNKQTVKYDSVNFIDKACLPDYTDLAKKYSSKYDSALSALGIDSISQSIQDMTRAWPVFVIAFLTCFIITFIYMFLLKHFAKVLAWISILLGFVGIIALGYFLYQKGQKKQDDGSTTKKYLKVAAYIIWGLSFLYILAVICLYKNIRIALGVLKSAATFVGSNMHTILLPFFALIFTILFASYWIVMAMFLFSSGEIKASTGGSQYKHLVWNDTLRYLIIYQVFALLWMAALIITCTQFILTVTVCIWYFSHGSDNKGKSSIWIGIKWIVFYNLGSIAFGSFLLALVWFLIITLKYIQKKLEKMSDLSGQVRIARAIVGCCQCCLQCCHRFVQYLNKNAYVQVALHGTNFCTSAINGFLLNLKNAGTFMMTEGLGGLFMFVGKIFIAIGNTLVAYAIITYWKDMNDKINSPIFPLSLVFTVSYTIASTFMSIFSQTSVSILQCFLSDVELSRSESDGSDGKHRPSALQELVVLLRKEGGK